MIFHETELPDANGFIGSAVVRKLLEGGSSVNAGTYWHTADNLRWLSASVKLMQACIRHGSGRIVTAGTSAEYQLADHPLRENEDVSPSGTLYAACKHSLLEIGTALCRKEDVAFAHGRVFYLYGSYEKEQRVFPYVIWQLLNGEPANVSSGEQLRDYLYVDDVASAFAAIASFDMCSAVNIASGEGVRLKDCFETMRRLIGAPQELSCSERSIPPSGSRR